MSKWKPKFGEKFWCVNGSITTFWKGFSVDSVIFEGIIFQSWVFKGNIFRTKKQATIAMNKIKKILGVKP